MIYLAIEIRIFSIQPGAVNIQINIEIRSGHIAHQWNTKIE